MADWRNRIEQITNKVKSQLFAKGVDNMNQLQDIFLVSKLFLLKEPIKTPSTSESFQIMMTFKKSAVLKFDQWRLKESS